MERLLHSIYKFLLTNVRDPQASLGAETGPELNIEKLPVFYVFFRCMQRRQGTSDDQPCNMYQLEICTPMAASNILLVSARSCGIECVINCGLHKTGLYELCSGLETSVV